MCFSCHLNLCAIYVPVYLQVAVGTFNVAVLFIPLLVVALQSVTDDDCDKICRGSRKLYSIAQQLTSES